MLLRPRVSVRAGLSSADISSLLALFTRIATLLVPPPGGFACPDPRDQHLWDLLATVPEAVLVTGDALLVENPPPFGRVMTPRQFVESYLPHPGG